MGQIKKEQGNIYVRNAGEGWKLIGRVDEENKTLSIKRYKSKHLHRVTNSYGVNKSAIEKGWFEHVVLTEDTGMSVNTYIIPVDELRVQPAYKAAGYEEQLMLNIDILKRWKV